MSMPSRRRSPIACPRERLLSHDLFEGTFARAGLVSDIEVVEEFPSRYDVAAARQHRWSRGDWQLLPWILGRGDAAGENRGSGTLPLIGLWKMLDNLRRTLSAPAGVAALLAGWLLPSSSALLWSAFICATIALPALLPVFAGILPNRAGVTIRSHLRALRKDVWLAAVQTAFIVTFLAHQATLMMDAIGRTLFRLLVSQRNLLQWVTAAQARLSFRLTLPSAYRRMAGAVAIAALGALIVGYFRSGNGWLAMPFLILWAASPAVAVWISISPLVAGRLADVGGGRKRLEIGCTPNLAILRDLRDGGRSDVAAGQFSGGPSSRGGPPHLADQHGPLPAVSGQRPRLWLVGNPRLR